MSGAKSECDVGFRRYVYAIAVLASALVKSVMRLQRMGFDLSARDLAAMGGLDSPARRRAVRRLNIKLDMRGGVADHQTQHFCPFARL